MDDHFRKAETLFIDGGEQALPEPLSFLSWRPNDLFMRVGIHVQEVEDVGQHGNQEP